MFKTKQILSRLMHSISSLLKNPIFVILSEAKDRISVGDSSAFGLRMTQLGLFQQTVS